LVEKLHERGRDQFLECPTSSKPPIATSLRYWRIRGKIRQVGKADGSLLIPLEHGVDALGELCATGFIDTAGVDPDVVKVLLER
jgi:hypothetical protein